MAIAVMGKVGRKGLLQELFCWGNDKLWRRKEGGTPWGCPMKWDVSREWREIPGVCKFLTLVKSTQPAV